MSKGYSTKNIVSVQRAIKNLNKFLESCETVPRQILAKEQKTIKAQIIAETPYKEGNLSRSVYVTLRGSKGRYYLTAGASVKSARGYDYSGIQHENTSFNHPIMGKANYIRDPFKRGDRRIRYAMRKELKFPKR